MKKIASAFSNARTAHTKLKFLAAAVVLPFFSGCGGGSSNEPCQQYQGGTTWTACTPPAPSTKPDRTLPEGIWGGGTSDGLAVSTLVLETGQYFIVPTSTNGVGLVEGIMTATNGNFSDNAAVVYASSSTPVAASTTGSFAAKKTMSGTVAATTSLSSPFQQGSLSVTFNGNYNSLYDTSATVAEAQGNWTGQTNASTAVVTLSIGSDGTFTGVNGTCTFNGSLTPRASGRHVLDGNVIFTNSSCEIGSGASMSFEAVVSGNQLVAAGVTQQRDHAFAVVATKN